MLRLLCVGALAALGIAVASCSIVTRGFYSEAQCKNKCGDPKCWVYAVCGETVATATRVVDAGATDTDSGAQVAARIDASSPISSFDAGTTSVADAAPPPDPCTNKVCASDETCSPAGTCVKKSDLPGTYEISVAFAVVSYANILSNCFNIGCGLPIPNFFCSCAPNTFVTVLVNGKAAGRTTTVDNSVNPTWKDPQPIEIHIASADDVITFVVVSEGLSLAKNPEIFRCDAALSGLAIGTLGCTSPWASTSATLPGTPTPIGGQYRVAANVTKKTLQ